MSEIKAAFKLGCAQILLFLGEICAALKGKKIAEGIFNLSLRIWPTWRAEILAHLSFLYERAGELDKAINKSREIIELEPQNASHYWELGCLYEKNNEFGLALENYRKALELDREFSVKFKEQIQARINNISQKNNSACFEK